MRPAWGRWVLVVALGLSAWASAAPVPYLRTRMKEQPSLCIFWQARHYVWQPDQAGYSQLPFSSVEQAMQASFQTWQTLSDWCSGFQFSEGPPVANAQVGYNEDGGFNANVITFREKSCASVPMTDPCYADDSCANAYKCWSHQEEIIALTTATYDTTTGVILDADIELNASPPASGGNPYTFTVVNSPPCPLDGVSQSCVATDLQNTLTHEIGHVVGLAHVDGGTSTMFATAQVGETRKRVIDNGTAMGLCEIYPANAGSTATCDLLSQSSAAISASNAGTTLGCNASGAGAPGWALWLVGLGIAGRWLVPLARRRAARARPGAQR